VSSAPAPCLVTQAKTRKRRTVLWLYHEDYEYLSRIASADGDSKNVSMRRLVKALRRAHVTSFINIEQQIVSKSRS
jgi:ABC-type metal ion transport system substrate-binding protein